MPRRILILTRRGRGWASWLLSCCGLILFVPEESAASDFSTLAPRLSRFCIECHGDAVVDGSDTQEFARGPNTLSRILGPVVLDGAGGEGSLSLGVVVMLPGEINRRPSDGEVLEFQANTADGPRCWTIWWTIWMHRSLPPYSAAAATTSSAAAQAPTSSTAKKAMTRFMAPAAST